MKKATNQSGILLAVAQMRAHLPHQLKAVLGPASTDGIGLGVVVEELVGIQVRPIGGKKEQLDLSLLRLDPFANAAGPMNGVPVDDQKNLPMTGLFEQTFEKLKEDAQAEFPLEQPPFKLEDLRQALDIYLTDKETKTRILDTVEKSVEVQTKEKPKGVERKR